MTKQFWVVLLAVVVLLGGIFWLTSDKADAPKSNSKNQSLLTNHVEGQGKTGVRLVEYGDYQCPACEQYYQPVKEAVAKYSKDIYFQFRNFPLTNLHPNAFAAARAAEAAGLQDKYWGMHDLLYQNQNAWAQSSNPMNEFADYAKQLDLNVDQFKNDFKSVEVNDAINADMAEGSKLKITGTPTFFIDGKRLDNMPPTTEAFTKAIKEAIAKKTGQPEKKDTSANSSKSVNQPKPAETKAKP